MGSNLAIMLKTKYPDYTVVVLDNLKRRGSELNLVRLREGGVAFQHGDIRNKEDLYFEKERFSLVIDASAEPSVLAGITSPVDQVINNNLTGTVNILEVARQHGAAFIFLSTSRIYPVAKLEQVRFTEEETRFRWVDEQEFSGVSAAGVTEYFPLGGSRTFYGATKLASELLIQEYQAHLGVKSVINRCGVITGPWQMGKVDQGVVVLWVARHLFKGQLGYFGYGGQGKQVRDLLHVNDLFDLIDWQIHHLDEVNGEIFNVGGGVDCSASLQELTRLCEKHTGNSINIVQQAENRVADIRVYLTDNCYVQKVTGWLPKYTPDKIIAEITRWIIANEKDLKPILT